MSLATLRNSAFKNFESFHSTHSLNINESTFQLQTFVRRFVSCCYSFQFTYFLIGLMRCCCRYGCNLFIDAVKHVDLYVHTLSTDERRQKKEKKLQICEQLSPCYFIHIHKHCTCVYLCIYSLSRRCKRRDQSVLNI